MADMTRYHTTADGTLVEDPEGRLCWADTAEARIAELERELAEVDAALNDVTKCIAPDRSQRIRDAFMHNDLVTDAVVFDAEKREESARAQTIYWMSQFKAAGEQLADLRAQLQAAYNSGGDRAEPTRTDTPAPVPSPRVEGDEEPTPGERYRAALEDAQGAISDAFGKAFASALDRTRKRED